MSDNVKHAQGVYDAFAKGDIETVLGAMAPDVDWNEAEHVTFWQGEPFIGPEAVVTGVFAKIPETFGDTFKVNIERLTGLGDTVLMEGRYTGIVQTTGEPLDAQVAHVTEWKDGKMVRFQQYTDTWAFERATGVKPHEA